jgi:hypothetical protein
MNIVDSEVSIYQSRIMDIISTKYFFNVIQSDLKITNTEITNITSPEDFVVVSVGTIEIKNVTYSHAGTDLLRSTYSDADIKYLSKYINLSFRHK